MKNRGVFAVKFIHSVIFFFMVFCLVYIFYCAVTRRYDWTLAVALGSLAAEGLALALNRGECPFTTLAKKLGDEKGSVTDIFLPDWSARNTFKISMIVLAIELVMLAWGYFTG